MNRNLKEIVNREPILKRCESLPIQFINDDKTDDFQLAVQRLYDIVKTLQTFSISSDNMEKFFEVFDKEDFNDIQMFLSEKLHVLKNTKLATDSK